MERAKVVMKAARSAQRALVEAGGDLRSTGAGWATAAAAAIRRQVAEQSIRLKVLRTLQPPHSPTYHPPQAPPPWVRTRHYASSLKIGGVRG